MLAWVGLAAGAIRADEPASGQPAAAQPAAPAAAQPPPAPSPSPTPEPSPTPKPIDYVNEIIPILTTYCYQCHNVQEHKGGLDLTRFLLPEQVLDSFELWETLAARVKRDDMPPKNKPRPADANRELLLKWLETIKPLDQGDCDRIANDENYRFYRGFVMSRRLNRTEYGNTLRDLFGRRLDVNGFLPNDGSGGEGFDNNGDALFTSPVLIEKYLDAADQILALALPVKAFEALAEPERSAARAKWLAGAGPDAAPDAVWKSIFTALPSNETPPREAARAILTRFAYRAFRRPPAPEEVDRLLTAFDRPANRGESFEASIRFALKAALISPEFLFLVEPEPEGQGVYPLGDYQLATRLSYFLWGSMPDDELFAIAELGMLRHPSILQAQIKRMLLDPKSRGLSERFSSQWLGLETLGGPVRPDPERFPEFTPELADAMREEATLLLDGVLRGNRSLLELINADYTYMNETLAAGVYGMGDVKGPEFRRVQLADPNRGGAMTLPAVLTATSHALRTSPVLRGKWTLEQILGERVAPPPPAVPSIPADDRRADGLTMRQVMEAHRVNPVCASCHESMDPIGLGLENFDPIGRWRTEQNGAPLDTAGKLPSGEAFAGPAELKGIVMARKEKFIRNLTKKMLGYALGRDLNRYDQCVIDGATKALDANDYKSWTLVENIVLSYPFSHRYSKK